MTRLGGGLPNYVREGRCAIHWSWYTSARYGAENHGMRGYNPDTHTFGDYPGWRIMRSQPHKRFGIAGGNRGNRQRKVHIVKDQVVAKHQSGHYDDQRLTRWLCGTYTFEAILQETAETVCSACLIKAQNRRTEPLPGTGPASQEG